MRGWPNEEKEGRDGMRIPNKSSWYLQRHEVLRIQDEPVEVQQQPGVTVA